MNHTRNITTTLLASLLLGCPSDPPPPEEVTVDMPPTAEDMGDTPPDDLSDMTESMDMTTSPDATMDEDMPPVVTPSGYELVRAATPWSPSNNLVEDPNFVLSTESWIAFDGDNAIQRVRRAYTTSAPAERPTIGLMPMSSQPSCIIGRVKWTRATNHEASIWVRGSGAAIVALALDIDRITPSLQAYDIDATDETYTANGQTWTKYSGIVPSAFGWGYLQVCHSTSETVWLGAPTVLTRPPTPSALGEHSPSRSRAATEEELERHEILTRRRAEREHAR